MSQLNGVSPQSSTTSTIQTSLNPDTSTSTSNQSAPTSEPASTDSGSFLKLSYKPNTLSIAPSSKVRIPRLSPATTELLARVAGNVHGEKKIEGNSLSWNSSYSDQTPISNSDVRSASSNKMRIASTYIDLPTPPFGGLHAASTSGVSQSAGAAAQTENDSAPANLAAIAPKPSTSSAPVPSTSVPVQPALATELASSTTAGRKKKAPAAPRRRNAATTGAKRGRKPKRDKNSDDEVVKAGTSSSDESDIAPAATQTKSGRQVTRPAAYAPPEVPLSATMNPLDASNSMPAPAAPAKKRKRVYRKKENNITCIHCERGNSPKTNQIVFCDGCNRSWHQLCHDPRIPKDVVTIEEKEWFCHECKPVAVQATHPTVPRSEPTKNKAPEPAVHHPLPESQIEVAGEGYSNDEKRGYLSRLSHATLVELVVAVSDRNPSIPMFPANLKSMPTSEFSYKSKVPTSHQPKSDDPLAPPKPAAQPKEKAPAKQGSSNGKRKAKADPAPSSRKRRRSDSPESEYEEFEEHRLYARTGNGFELSHEDEDLDALREDPNCPTFSHALHGPAKARAEENEPAPVCETM